MTIIQSINKTPNRISSLSLWEMILLDNQIEQLSPGHKLHNQTKMSFILKNIDQLDNIGMINLFQNINFI